MGAQPKDKPTPGNREEAIAFQELQDAQRARNQKQQQVMNTAFDRLYAVSQSVWNDFIPADLMNDEFDRFEPTSPTFGRAQEAQRASVLDSAPGEDDFPKPEIYIHPTVIDADDDDASRSLPRGSQERATTPPVADFAARRGTPTGGSGRATPERVKPDPAEDTSQQEPEQDCDDNAAEEAVPAAICGGRFRDVEHLKEWLKDLLEEPTTSMAAKVVSIVVLVCIIISTVNIILESLPSMDPNRSGTKDHYWRLFVIESFCIFVFSVEYSLRLWAVAAHESRLAWMRQPMNLIDLIAILPFFIDLAMLIADAGEGGALKILRLFRLIRIFRIFKLSRYSENVQMCASAMLDSQETLGLMIFMLLIAVTMFSAFEYFFEMGDLDEATGKYMITAYGVEQESKFTSIPGTMWWCVVTLMTVGYGDMFPVTSLGKIFAILCMICAILILALPISVIGANFSQAWLASKEAKEKVSEGRELSRELQSVLSSMGEYNDLLEDMLSDACRALEELQIGMGKARQIFNQEYASAGGLVVEPDGPKPVVPQGKLLKQVQIILAQHSELNSILFKIEHLYSDGVEEKVSSALESFKEMEDLVAQCSVLRERIGDVEYRALGQDVSAESNRVIDHESKNLP